MSRLFGGLVEMPRERYQEPALKQTSRGGWFIRPWVDVIVDGRVTRAKKTIRIEATGKREAESKAREIMRTINRADYVIASQVNIGLFLDEYQTMHVNRLAASTQAKYRNHIKNHIRPAFGNHRLCDLTPLLVQKWLDEKKLSWATRTDLRNILSSMFTRAGDWGLWKDSNPIERVSAGRRVAVREQRKLTDDETRRLLAALPGDVRLMCCACLFGALRISEALGLQGKHLDFKRGVIQVRQRFYRGDLDIPKNQAAIRDVPMGYLAEELAKLATEPEQFVFRIKTRPEWGRKECVCRDDRDIHQHFLRPAAKAIGAYWPGFGFHALRREAVTAFAAALGTSQAMRVAGHSTMDMSLRYTLSDQEAQDHAVRARQEEIIGATGEKVN